MWVYFSQNMYPTCYIKEITDLYLFIISNVCLLKNFPCINCIDFLKMHNELSVLENKTLKVSSLKFTLKNKYEIIIILYF